MKCDIAKGPKRIPIVIEYRNTTSEEKKVRFPLHFSEKKYPDFRKKCQLCSSIGYISH